MKLKKVCLIAYFEYTVYNSKEMKIKWHLIKNNVTKWNPKFLSIDNQRHF